MNARRAFLASLLALAVTGCGFELRRPVSLPFSTLYIQAPRALKDPLTRAIRYGTQVTIVDSPQAAQAVLDVTREAGTQDLLSLNAQGQAAAYTLIEQVTFQLRGAHGGLLLAPQTIRLTRDLEYNPNKVLALSDEQAGLYDDMRNDIANQIMWRLRVLRPATP